MARISRIDRPVACALVAGLAVLVAAHLASGFSGTSLAATVHDQADITAGTNLAAVYQCVVALVAALLCVRIAWTNRCGWSWVGWMAIASGLIITCVLEFIAAPGSLRVIPLMVALVSVPIVVFMYRKSRHCPGSRLLLAIFLILMLSNPVTDRIERHITSNNDNYTFVAANEPYAFNPDAWNRLRIVSHVQEISEILAIIAIVAITETLIASSSTEATRRRYPSTTAQHG
jgi:hypothetical protein